MGSASDNVKRLGYGNYLHVDTGYSSNVVYGQVIEGTFASLIRMLFTCTTLNTIIALADVKCMSQARHKGEVNY